VDEMFERFQQRWLRPYTKVLDEYSERERKIKRHDYTEKIPALTATQLRMFQPKVFLPRIEDAINCCYTIRDINKQDLYIYMLDFQILSFSERNKKIGFMIDSAYDLETETFLFRSDNISLCISCFTTRHGLAPSTFYRLGS